MADLTPEALARQQIDAMLVACGWVIQDYSAINLSAGKGIAVREVPLKSGRCDYLLLVDRKPVGVIEAKKVGTTLSTVAEQSGHYAGQLPDFLAKLLPSGVESLPFLYESTGTETFFRDERDPHPRSRGVFSFHRPETLAGWIVEPETLRARLARMPVAHPLSRQGLRACQFEAITKLEQSFAEDHPRSLIQMATGAGKTFTACSFAYRLIKHAGAKRILFLVDRSNLGRQAAGEFAHFVTPDSGRKFTELYNVQHLTSNKLDNVSRVTTAPSSASTPCCAGRPRCPRTSTSIPSRTSPISARRMSPTIPTSPSRPSTSSSPTSATAPSTTSGDRSSSISTPTSSASPLPRRSKPSPSSIRTSSWSMATSGPSLTG